MLEDHAPYTLMEHEHASLPDYADSGTKSYKTVTIYYPTPVQNQTTVSANCFVILAKPEDCCPSQTSVATRCFAHCMRPAAQ